MNQIVEHETITNGEIVTAPAPLPPHVITTPYSLLEKAVASGAGIEVIERLMTLHERNDANQARKAFDEAMSAAKAEIPVISKNRTVDFVNTKGTRTNYRHEDLAEIARTVNPILGKHGLSYRFRTTANVNEPVSVTCIVTHRLGYFEENTLVGPRDDTGNKNSLQQVGSTLTYLQRMTLKAALGLAAAEDDDAQSCGNRGGTSEFVELVTDQQSETLRALLGKTGVNIGAFLKRLNAESLSDIPASLYAESLAFLQNRLKIQEERAAQVAQQADDFPGDRT